MLRVRLIILCLLASSFFGNSPIVINRAEATDGVQTISCSISGNFRVTTTGSDVKVSNGSSCVGNAIIPNGSTSIEDEAFYNASGLNNVSIPHSVIRLGFNAFASSGLREITIPDGIRTIEWYAFESATFIETFTVTSGNQYFSSDVNGVLFNKAKTILWAYPAGKVQDTYIIPSTVTTIGRYAFNSSRISSIEIPASVVTVEGSAFSNSARLQTVTFAPLSQLTSIGGYAFYGTELTSIVFPASLTRLSDSLFRYNTRITTVSFATGSNLTSIGQETFYRATSLNSITLPNSLTSIGNSAFMTTTLRGITIPSNVTIIDAYAFYDASALESITIPSLYRPQSGGK